MKYRHLIFDIDGTLLDTESTGVLSLRQTIKELMGEDLDYEKVYPYFGIPSDKVAGILGYEGPISFEERWEENFVALWHLMKPFAGVEGVLAEARRMGYGTGVVTSRSHKELAHDPHMLPLLPYIDHIICAGDTARPKPFPDPMYRYLELASASSDAPVPPGECLYFGDTEHDWHSAHSAGIDFAYADWRGRGLPPFPVEHIFRNAEEMKEIITGGKS